MGVGMEGGPHEAELQHLPESGAYYIGGLRLHFCGTAEPAELTCRSQSWEEASSTLAAVPTYTCKGQN